MQPDTECNCGGTIFNKEALMWCCQESNCTGKGGFSEMWNYWSGETDQEGGKKIGAECSNGRALNLTQACKGTCNYHKEDENRNAEGFLRSHLPCQVNNLKTTQCIPEHEESNGVFNCKNRADEKAFLSHIVAT